MSCCWWLMYVAQLSCVRHRGAPLRELLLVADVRRSALVCSRAPPSPSAPPSASSLPRSLPPSTDVGRLGEEERRVGEILSLELERPRALPLRTRTLTHTPASVWRIRGAS